jgi:serine/threonine protein kinase
MTVGQLAAAARARIAGGLPVELAAGIMRDAARGLHAAHEARLPDGTELRIVHRDVSPQNVVATYGGEVKLVDFGVAHAAVREARTRAGTVKGKVAYMAPEQCQGKAVDRRTDVFAVGVVLWELITGARLFRRPSRLETMKAVFAGATVPPSAASGRGDPALDAIVMRALSADPRRRQPTAAALADELEAWLAARGVGPTGPHLAALYARWFAPELSAHRARLADLRAGRPISGSLATAWDGDDDGEAPRAVSSAGPEERTVVAAAAPSGKARRIPPAVMPLFILGALALFAVAVALLVRLLR